MGKAAYEKAKLEGTLIQQRLRKVSSIFDHAILCNEAADLIDWLSKERDSMIEQLQDSDDIHQGRYHHPDCNYWKWDWRYSWSSTDCNCE